MGVAGALGLGQAAATTPGERGLGQRRRPRHQGSTGSARPRRPRHLGSAGSVSGGGRDTGGARAPAPTSTPRSRVPPTIQCALQSHEDLAVLAVPPGAGRQHSRSYCAASASSSKPLSATSTGNDLLHGGYNKLGCTPSADAATSSSIGQLAFMGFVSLSTG